MSFWNNQIAVVTDIESKLGLCITKTLIGSGIIVIGFYKSVCGFKRIKKKLTDVNENTEKIFLYQCDITDVNQLKDIFNKIKEKHEGPSVLINNALCNIECCLCESDLENVKTIIEININAVIACTRLVAGHMIEKNNRGHIIFITDFTNNKSMNSNIFLASKTAVKSINDILREEFRYVNANIKVTNIICECVEDMEEITSTKPETDVAEIVKFVLNTAEHLQVHEILLDLDAMMEREI